MCRLWSICDRNEFEITYSADAHDLYESHQYRPRHTPTGCAGIPIVLLTALAPSVDEPEVPFHGLARGYSELSNGIVVFGCI
jgi:hypothetical protein